MLKREGWAGDGDEAATCVGKAESKWLGSLRDGSKLERKQA